MKNIKILFVLASILFLFSCQPNQIRLNENNINKILLEFYNPSSSKVLIAAHRAMHTKYPENSLAAYQHSIDNGIDIIETDIRTTKDGKLVLMHDDSVDRTSNGKGKIRNYTYNDLQKLKLKDKYDVGEIFNIPLAKDAFNLARGKILLDLDLKDVSIKQLVKLVHKTKVEKQVLFFDSDFAVLDSVLLLDSTLIIMPRAHSLEEVKNIIERYHPRVIHIDPSFYTKEVVNLIKKNGARIWINALGKTDMKAFAYNADVAYGQLLENGANIIQTDLPVILKTYLKKKKLR